MIDFSQTNASDTIDPPSPGGYNDTRDKYKDNGHTLLPLTVHSLGYAVHGKTLLRDINLTVGNNGITVILGHNGAGKSLLLRVLHGLLTPSQGTISWNNQSAAHPRIRKAQAMVFQKPVLLRRSVAANIDYVLALRQSASREQRDSLLRGANLQARSKQLATSLSGGEQQRLAIARALATNPSVVFLDEPTASMDPAATSSIEQQIQSVNRQGIKIIMVTHDIAQARRLADDVIYLHQGSVAEHTNAHDFFAQARSSAAQNYLAGLL